MITQILERTFLYPAQPACSDDDTATQRAENEGMPGLSKRPPKWLARFTKEQELTLEQLLADLKTISLSDALISNQTAPLMCLIASDIRDAKHFSIDSSLSARSMRSWRQRYNGLDCLLR